MVKIRSLEVKTISMVSTEGLQRVDLHYDCKAVARLTLEIFRGELRVIDPVAVTLDGCKGVATVMLPVQSETFDALWQLTDGQGNVLAQTQAPWTRPRERTMYVMLSSHTDIGLHNSQYIQRHNSCRFLDMAKDLCDKTADRREEDQYRYTMEGTWFWNNYGMDRGAEVANALVQDYIKQGKMGVCCGVAGNHTQVYGLEELCRSAYGKKRLKDIWNLSTETMTMIDNNGMSMSLIGPYSQAGIKNIIFAPNQWNPLLSTIWKPDVSKHAPIWNCDAGGGGSRIDIRYDSEQPMVFYWENDEGNRILVWGSTQYTHGATAFGLYPEKNINSLTLPIVEDSMAKQLPQLDEKYPYDVWLMCCYADDQEPDCRITDTIAMWNERWQWPKLRTLGNPDEPFRILREKHNDQIPVARGEIAGGWYQHPVAAAELLAQKLDADRLLPTAEKWSSVAAMLDENYAYPAEQFRRAWDYLLYNDEHSYGTSGYQGRRVYETWMQHRDWIDKAQHTAQTESQRALQAVAAHIHTEKNSLTVFNPTALDRKELVTTADGRYAVADIPAFGYRVIGEDALRPCQKTEETTSQPPIVENKYYKLTFAENGAVQSIFDKELKRELLDSRNAYGANALVYTKDNHKTFCTAEAAEFTVTRDAETIIVVAKTAIPGLGAEILQSVTLPAFDKRIDIDNRLYHVKDMVNCDRYYRYLYYAFPFEVKNSRRYCHLNGAVAEYAKDVTGHGTDVYMAVNEWCCAENENFGVALMMLDSQLVEFDHIHPDKTDFGNAGAGSQMFVYLANDWLQMHTPGGSHVDYRFRYRISSYSGGYAHAGVPQMAERFVNPVQTITVPAQAGKLQQDSCSFMKIPTGQRLIALKRAEDGDGLITRLYGTGADPVLETGFGSAQRVRVDETSLDTQDPCIFATYRLGSGTIRLPERNVEEISGKNGAPAPIGSVYTGLITEPCAAAGEHSGHLYLLWGQSIEEDFSHYKLYRSETPGFTADETTFVADIAPEEYCVGRYEDTGLKEHTCYYYRVCAVNKAGQQSPLSREFCAFTKEETECC